MSFSTKLRLYRKKKKSLTRGEIELHILRFLCNYDRVAIDVGANKGNYALEMSKYSKRVICIEPNPGFNKYLSKMPNNCEVINAAASSSQDTTFLHAPLIDGDAKHNMAFISSDKSIENAACLSQVKTVKLDDYCDQNVGMIKIDVEGGEMDVLNSAHKLVRTCSPNFLIESLTKEELANQIDFFKSYEYVALKIIKDDIYFVKDQDIFDMCREIDRNTIFIPSNVAL
jgi:FkbM family methyltransferase